MQTAEDGGTDLGLREDDDVRILRLDIILESLSSIHSESVSRSGGSSKLAIPALYLLRSSTRTIQVTSVRAEVRHEAKFRPHTTSAQAGAMQHRLNLQPTSAYPPPSEVLSYTHTHTRELDQRTRHGSRPRTFFCAAASPHMFHAAMRTVPSIFGGKLIWTGSTLFVGCCAFPFPAAAPASCEPALLVSAALLRAFAFPFPFTALVLALVAAAALVLRFLGAGSCELSASDANEDVPSSSSNTSSSDRGGRALRLDAAARFGGIAGAVVVVLVVGVEVVMIVPVVAIGRVE